MSQHVPLTVSTREARGSTANKRLRKAGRVPGVLYQPGGDSLAFDADEYSRVTWHIASEAARGTDLLMVWRTREQPARTHTPATAARPRCWSEKLAVENW